MNTSKVTREITDSAIEWFVRLRAEDVTDTEHESIFDWLHASPEHQQAFVNVLEMWEGVSVVKQMDFDELRSFPQILAFKRKAEVTPS